MCQTSARSYFINSFSWLEYSYVYVAIKIITRTSIISVVGKAEEAQNLLVLVRRGKDVKGIESEMVAIEEEEGDMTEKSRGQRLEQRKEEIGKP